MYLVITCRKFAHLYDFSIRSFDCMVYRSFPTLSRYDFRSNVIRPNFYCKKMTQVEVGYWLLNVA